MTPLSYIFHALFRDTTLGQVYRAQPNNQIGKLTKYLAIWLGMLNIAKWGIPEKSMTNVAQRRRPEVRRTLQSKAMAKIDFGVYIPLYFTL